MERLFFPIVGRIDSSKFEELNKVIKEIGPESELISYISSLGGEAEYMSLLTGTIKKLPIKKIAFAGEKVFSSASIILCSFDERICFEDSIFLIHEPFLKIEGGYKKKFKKSNEEIFTFMSERMKKISKKDLSIWAKREEYFSAEKAMEIGLINKIIPMTASFENFESILQGTAQF